MGIPWKYIDGELSNCHGDTHHPCSPIARYIYQFYDLSHKDADFVPVCGYIYAKPKSLSQSGAEMEIKKIKMDNDRMDKANALKERMFDRKLKYDDNKEKTLENYEKQLIDVEGLILHLKNKSITPQIHVEIQKNEKRISWLEKKIKSIKDRDSSSFQSTPQPYKMIDTIAKSQSLANPTRPKKKETNIDDPKFWSTPRNNNNKRPKPPVYLGGKQL